MSRRTEKRKFLALSVRAFARNGSSRHVVCTLDLSAHGARVSGLPQIDVGQEVILEHKNNRVRFEAMWVGQPSTSREGQVGLRSLEPEKKLAELDEHLGGEWVDHWSPERKLAEIEADRRSVQRFDCDRGVQYWTKEGDSPLSGRLENISLTGCGILTKFPLPHRTRLNIVLFLCNMKIAAMGEVRACWEDRMGVMFTSLDQGNEARLKKAVQRLKLPARAAERSDQAKAEHQQAEIILNDIGAWFDHSLIMCWEDFFDIQVRLKGSLVKATEIPEQLYLE
jgi:hypothetical protein